MTEDVMNLVSGFDAGTMFCTLPSGILRGFSRRVANSREILALPQNVGGVLFFSAFRLKYEKCTVAGYISGIQSMRATACT